ncbi:MAG TPA: hypothetical protein PLO62_15615, partial [Candidatus Hydrogenedentes bacterium]|nr:hypothetical protein [Candidatus Hydrogenedentota bacterium]
MKSLILSLTAILCVYWITGSVLADDMGEATTNPALNVSWLLDSAKKLASKRDEASIAQRRQLAQFVESMYKEAAEKGQIDWKQWLDLVAVLGADFSSETQSIMVKDLAAKMIPDEAAIGQLDADSILKVTTALSRLGDQDSASSAYVTWVNRNDSWQSWDSGKLASFSGKLAGEEEAAKQARLRLAAEVAKRLGDPELVAKTSTYAWRDLVGSLKEDLSETARAEWATKLRTAFSAADLKAADVNRVSETLRRLGDPNDATFVAQWVGKNGIPKDADTGILSGFATSLSEGDAETVVQARRTLAAEIASRLKDPEVVAKTKVYIWCGMTLVMAKNFNENECADWAAKLRATFSATDLEAWDVERVSGALQKLGDPNNATFTAQWVGKNGIPKDADNQVLVAFAKRLSTGDEESIRQARQTVVSEITTRLGDVESVVKSGTHTWYSMAITLAKTLDENVRAEWATKLRAAFGAADLNVSDLGRMSGALKTLGDKNPTTFVAGWMETHPAWRNWSLKEQIALSGTLDLVSEVGKAAGEKLAAAITAKYTADLSIVQQLNWGEWRALARRLAPSLQGEIKQQLIGKVREGAGGKELKYADWKNVHETLAQLGDGDVVGFLAGWTDRASSWQEWKANELADLAGQLKGEAEAVKAARSKVIDRVAVKYLADATAIREVGANTWRSMAIVVAESLS